MLCNIIVVGWRENEKYFKMCLESIKCVNKENVNKIYIIVDGDEGEDQYMIEMAKGIFNGEYVHKGLNDTNEAIKIQKWWRNLKNKTIIFI